MRWGQTSRVYVVKNFSFFSAVSFNKFSTNSLRNLLLSSTQAGMLFLVIMKRFRLGSMLDIF